MTNLYLITMIAIEGENITVSNNFSVHADKNKAIAYGYDRLMKEHPNADCRKSVADLVNIDKIQGVLTQAEYPQTKEYEVNIELFFDEDVAPIRLVHTTYAMNESEAAKVVMENVYKYEGFCGLDMNIYEVA